MSRKFSLAMALDTIGCRDLRFMCALTPSTSRPKMRLLDAHVLDGALILAIDGGPEMSGAKATVAKALGCEVHLATPRMIETVRTTSRKPGESNVQFRARLAILDMMRGRAY
jgi:hypothetical protein